MRNREFMIHGTSSESDARGIENEGFEFKEGRASISQSLLYALEWATKPERRKGSESKSAVGPNDQGRIIIMKSGEGYNIDYANHTDIHIDQDTKEITGYPSKYVSGRKQQAIYKIEQESADQEISSKNIVSKENILLSIRPTEDLIRELKSLESNIRELKPLDITDLSRRVAEAVSNSTDEPHTTEEILPMITTLIKTTIEAEAVNQVRSISMDIKRLEGYKIYNRPDKQSSENPIQKEDLMRKLKQMESALGNPDYTSGLEGVDRYVRSNVSKFISQVEAL